MLAALMIACGSSGSQPGTGTGMGTGSAYKPVGVKPANAGKAIAPPQVGDHAIAVGAAAPAISLPDDLGASWTLGDALAKHARVVLVFYRGDW